MGHWKIKEHLRLEGEVDGYDLGYDFDDGIVAQVRYHLRGRN